MSAGYFGHTIIKRRVRSSIWRGWHVETSYHLPNMKVLLVTFRLSAKGNLRNELSKQEQWFSNTVESFVERGLTIEDAVMEANFLLKSNSFSRVLSNEIVRAGDVRSTTREVAPPRFGERFLLLILRTREERINIPGDLEEEFKQIAAKHGARYAKLWYYKQVAASAWPMARKAVGWGLLASIGAWIRRYI